MSKTQRANLGDEWIQEMGQLILINHRDPDEMWICTTDPIDVECVR